MVYSIEDLLSGQVPIPPNPSTVSPNSEAGFLVLRRLAAGLKDLSLIPSSFLYLYSAQPGESDLHPLPSILPASGIGSIGSHETVFYICSYVRPSIV
jgi:hypothetical protein